MPGRDKNRHEARPGFSRRDGLAMLMGAAVAGGVSHGALGAPRRQATPAANGSGYQVEGYPPYGPFPAPTLAVLDRSGDSVEVDTALGPVLAPANPQRIVALNIEDCELLISLGMFPVGVAHYNRVAGVPAAYRDLAPGITLLPTLEASPPDPEQVLALNPDLLFGDLYLGPEQYGPLQAIAPTVVPKGPKSPGVTWPQVTHDVGTVFGREAQAEDVLGTFRERAAAIAAQVHQVIPAGSTVHTIFFFPDSLWLYSVGYEADGVFWPINQWVWEYLELQPGDATRDIPLADPFRQLSLELMPQLDADFLLVFPGGYDVEPSPIYEESVASPLWQANPVVQAGRAFTLNLEVALGYYTNLALMEAFRDQIGAG